MKSKGQKDDRIHQRTVHNLNGLRNQDIRHRRNYAECNRHVIAPFVQVHVPIEGVQCCAWNLLTKVVIFFRCYLRCNKRSGHIFKSFNWQRVDRAKS